MGDDRRCGREDPAGGEAGRQAAHPEGAAGVVLPAEPGMIYAEFRELPLAGCRIGCEAVREQAQAGSRGRVLAEALDRRGHLDIAPVPATAGKARLTFMDHVPGIRRINPDEEAARLIRQRAGTPAGDGPDLRMTVEGDVLGVVSGHGGEVIAAGPAMHVLVQELTDLVLQWRTRPWQEAGSR